MSNGEGIDIDNLKVLSSLMAMSARPSPEDLVDLSRHSEKNDFRDCCLRAITSAVNPLIPGMNLSLTLATAANQAPEGDRRRIREVQASADALLLEIFERLPQTVRAFDGKIAACRAVLEQNDTRTDAHAGFTGPLGLMLSEKQQREKYCSEPLVMDYLTRMFTLGLPSPRDSKRVLSDRAELDYMAGEGKREICLVYHRGVVFRRLRPLIPGFFNYIPLLNVLLEANVVDRETIDDSNKNTSVLFGPGSFRASLSIRTLLQGANDRFPSLTMLPGAQFMAAGILAMPNDFYRVPAMRMLLDFVVYVGMLAVLGYFVLFHSTPSEEGFLASSDEIVDRPLGFWEALVASIFVLVRWSIYFCSNFVVCCLSHPVRCSFGRTHYVGQWV